MHVLVFYVGNRRIHTLIGGWVVGGGGGGGGKITVNIILPSRSEEGLL